VSARQQLCLDVWPLQHSRAGFLWLILEVCWLVCLSAGTQLEAAAATGVLRLLADEAAILNSRDKVRRGGHLQLFC